MSGASSGSGIASWQFRNTGHLSQRKRPPRKVMATLPPKSQLKRWMGGLACIVRSMSRAE
jgi:hypothetical protein